MNNKRLLMNDTIGPEDRARITEHLKVPPCPSAKIITDSISDQGHRLVTMEVNMHRFILAEMNTHRSLSKNSASSRAIPFSKTRAKVKENIAFPIHWGAEQKGMQSGDSVQDVGMCQTGWEATRDKVVRSADILHEHYGLHKSLVNRLLEPFMWHTCIITGTEFSNFFHQRCSTMAQPEMKAVADAMQIAYFTSAPKHLVHGQWHMPYLIDSDIPDVGEYLESKRNPVSQAQITATLKEISVARCARVSYNNQDGTRDITEDLKLYDRLRTSGHWSPFEHVATPIMPGTLDELCGNFVGWKQFRKNFTDENFTKFLPNLPELAQQRMRMEAGLNPWKGGSE